MMGSTSRPRRVLILTASFGSGHVRAAHAVAEAIACQAPAADVRVVDILAEAWWFFRVLYVWPYWVMLRVRPSWWKSLYTKRQRRKNPRTAPGWLFRLGCSRVFASLAAFDPDVIVAAEVAAGEIASIARRRGLTFAPIVSVITDHHGEPTWVSPFVDRYAVADEAVAAQLEAWGVPPDRIDVCGIPTAATFQTTTDRTAVRRRYTVPANRPLVLVMGGGMGPTRMDEIVRDLCAAGEPMHIVAVAGRDHRMRRRLDAIPESACGRDRARQPSPSYGWSAVALAEAETREGAARGGGAPRALRNVVTVRVLGWTDDVSALMKTATVVVTKPGGVTTAEAAVCGRPVVFLKGIPGPEEHNAAWAVRSGGCLAPQGRRATTVAILQILRDEGLRASMIANARHRARPAAATAIAELTLATANQDARHPVVLLSISNGAGHMQTAEAIAAALRTVSPSVPVTVIDVADYMTFVTRMTHVTIFLWLVTHAPRIWGAIDRYQKRQRHTSPEWYYRRGCARLFALVRKLQPEAIVATEVGCCEIAALIVRDLRLSCPVVAVNGEYDADRAWVQPEVTLYSVPDVTVREELCAHGAKRDRIQVWGVPLSSTFLVPPRRETTRTEVCVQLALDPEQSIVLVSGGSEGLGRPEVVVQRLLSLPATPQIVVLAGHNPRLKRRCEALARLHTDRTLRVLGWTSDVARLMVAADLLVSKLGHTFDEAVALGLPIVALEPPPGSERIQHRLVDEWGVGCAVHDLDQMADAVTVLTTHPATLAAMRAAATVRPRSDAAREIARSLLVPQEVAL
jgi:processive 1,2-diacylglycerol beta-glucosyltransferase